VKLLKTAQVPIEQLAPFPENARNGDVTAIGESLREHDQYRAIVVWASDGDGSQPMQVLAGNHVYFAAGEAGRGRLLCHLIECSYDEAKRINLADNRIAELGGFDHQQLANLLQSLDGEVGEPGYFAGTGYNVESLEHLLDRIRRDEDQTIRPEPPPLVCPECGHTAAASEFAPAD
jgi:hypothetical protein